MRIINKGSLLGSQETSSHIRLEWTDTVAELELSLFGSHSEHDDPLSDLAWDMVHVQKYLTNALCRWSTSGLLRICCEHVSLVGLIEWLGLLTGSDN